MADVEEEEAPPEAEDEQNEGEEAEEDLDGEGDYEDQEGEEEEQSDGEEEDPFELLDESEPEDEEQQAMYKEYLELVKEIDAQNLIIRELKAKSTRLMYKKCKTFRDKQEYKRLRACQEQEDIHLRALVNRAIQLQNFGSPRRYGDVELEFTEADQSYFFTGLQPSSYSDCESCSVCCFSESDLDSDSDDDLCCT